MKQIIEGKLINSENYNKALKEIRKYLFVFHKLKSKNETTDIFRYAKLKHCTLLNPILSDCQLWVIKIFNLEVHKQNNIKRIEVFKQARKTDYKIFLLSKYWQNVKSKVLKRDGNKCTKCNSKVDLLPHHLTYKNHFNELNHLEDLITLCSHCHKSEHHINEKQEIESHFKSI